MPIPLLARLVCSLSFGVVVAQPPVAAAAEPAREFLWAGRAPFALGDEPADRPSLAIYPAPAALANGTAVVVCPGGGYGALALQHEGHEVAAHLNSLGISAFVLTYRIAPRYRHPCPLLDVQRAIRFVRSGCATWNVDPARIGVLGFSAGGHLAATALTLGRDGDPAAVDAIERVACRPDFGILVYPVIALDQPHTHQGSRRNLLGERADDPELRTSLSPERQVAAGTPPCFLVHTSADTVVPVENSIDFYLALRRAKVPAELHVYEHGEHGFGLASRDAVLGSWTGRLTDWLRGRGLLPARRN